MTDPLGIIIVVIIVIFSLLCIEAGVKSIVRMVNSYWREK